MMETLFAIFYVDDAYIASREPETNIKKMQAMTCTPGTIRLQLPTKSYLWMRTGQTPAAEWDAHSVTCRECGKDMRARSLGRHLADQHEIYQMQVVAEELLNRREGVIYEVPLSCGKLKCPFPLCTGELATGWMMRRHFRDLHPFYYVMVKKEGRYLRCPCCTMQVDPWVPMHINTKECRIGTARRHQWDMAVCSALALRQQSTVHGDVLERVEVFRYLGRLLSQDDDDIQAVRSQLCKARRDMGTGRTGVAEGECAPTSKRQVLQGDRAVSPPVWKRNVGSVPGRFRLEGFHIHVAYRMAKEHVPRRRPLQHWV
jgi:hypothetical protein